MPRLPVKRFPTTLARPSLDVGDLPRPFIWPLNMGMRRPDPLLPVEEPVPLAPLLEDSTIPALRAHEGPGITLSVAW